MRRKEKIYSLDVLRLLILSTFFCACSTATSPRKALNSFPIKKTDVAYWAYAPAERSEVLYEEQISTAEKLLLDRAGTRWLVAANAEGRASAQRAPEAFIYHAERNNEHVFIGRRGGRYVADSLLGEFKRQTLPSQHFESVIVVGDTPGSLQLQGLSVEGELYISLNLGLSFKKIPTRTSMRAQMPVRGGSLLLSLPERYWFRDASNTLHPLTTRPVGTTAFQQVAPDFFVAVGASGLFEWRAGSFQPAHLQERFTLTPEVAERFQLASLQFEVSARDEQFQYLFRDKDTAELLRSRIGAPLESVKSQGLPDACPGGHLVANGQHLALFCASGTVVDSGQPLLLFSSKNGGKSFSHHQLPLMGILSELLSALSEEGVLMLQGLCTAADSSNGCRPHGVERIQLATEQREEIALPGADTVAAMAWNQKVGWLVGRRAKSRRLLLFRLPELQHAEFIELRSENRTTESPRGDAPQLSFEGGLGVLLNDEDKARHLYVFDRFGGLRAVNSFPLGVKKVAGHGFHWLAMDGLSTRVWESVDAGASFRASSLPRNSCQKDSQCDREFHCASDGCIFEEGLTRTGWGTRLSEVIQLYQETPQAHSLESETPAWICSQSGRKRQLSLQEAPRIELAAFAQTQWWMGQENARGQLVGYELSWGQSYPVRQTYLEALSGTKAYSSRFSSQVEGAVFLRQSRKATAASTQVVTIDLITHQFKTRELKGLPALSSRSSTLVNSAQSTRAKVAQLQLLSLAGRRINIQLPGASAKLFSFDEAGQADTINLSALGPELKAWVMKTNAQFDIIDSPLGLQPIYLSINSGQVALLPPLSGSRGSEQESEPATISTVALREKGAHDVQSGIAYKAQKIGIFSFDKNLRTGQQSISFSPLNGSTRLEAPLLVPLARQLERKLRPCTQQERENYPRLLLSFEPAELSQLLLSDGKVRLFRASRAIIYGDKDVQCLAAVEAEEEKEEGSNYGSLLLFPGYKSFYFSRSKDEASLDAVPLECEPKH